MAFSLEFPDKYQLWAELLKAHGDRLFIATDEAAAIGDTVPVELVLPEPQPRVPLLGSVVALRRSSARFSAGIYVRFSDDELDKCRRCLGLRQLPERYEEGRRAVRIACELSVRFVRPMVKEASVAKNVSLTGILATCPVALLGGQRVELMLTLAGGEEVPALAEVSWARNDERLVGLRFVNLSEEAKGLIGRCIERLTAPEVGGRNRQMVVVADEDARVVEHLSSGLSKQGYSVRQAKGGDETLSLVRALRPQMVVIDVLMPGVDGMDVCKTMRADVEMVDIPVIFLGALDAQRLHEVADRAGATDYLSKPVLLDELATLVRSYLKKA